MDGATMLQSSLRANHRDESSLVCVGINILKSEVCARAVAVVQLGEQFANMTAFVDIADQVMKMWLDERSSILGMAEAFQESSRPLTACFTCVSIPSTVIKVYTSVCDGDYLNALCDFFETLLKCPDLEPLAQWMGYSMTLSKSHLVLVDGLTIVTSIAKVVQFSTSPLKKGRYWNEEGYWDGACLEQKEKFFNCKGVALICRTGATIIGTCVPYFSSALSPGALLVASVVSKCVVLWIDTRPV